MFRSRRNMATKATKKPNNSNKATKGKNTANNVGKSSRSLGRSHGDSSSNYNDDNEFDNALIIDNLFAHSKMMTNGEVNQVLDRTYKRVQRDTEQNFESMKETLRLAASQYTHSNVNNTVFTESDVEKDGDDRDHFDSEADEKNIIKKDRNEEKDRKISGDTEVDAEDDKFEDRQSRATLETLARSFDEADMNDSLRIDKGDTEKKVSERVAKVRNSKKTKKAEAEENEKLNKGDNGENIKERKAKGKAKKAKILRDDENLKEPARDVAPKRNTVTEDYIRNVPPPVPTTRGRTKERQENDAADKRIPETNLQIRAWSVASFDSCGGDTRRNYANFLLTNRRNKIKQKVANTLAFFKGPNEDTMYNIPRKLSSHYVDTQPYGPLDEEHPYYLELANKKKGKNLISASISRISGKSLGTSKSPRSNNKNNGVRAAMTVKLSKVGTQGLGLGNRAITKFFSGRKSRAGTELEEMDVGAQSVAEIEDKHDDDDDEKEGRNQGDIMNELVQMRKGKDKEKENEVNLQVFNEQAVEGEQKEMVEEGVLNGAPRYVPPDLEWDEKANNGNGGFVNKVPQYIPKGKIWSKEANGGLGGLINRQPAPGSIPPGRVWSRTAYNGQGGIVNMPPAKIPRGKKWDLEAYNGMGGLVDVAKHKMKMLNGTKEKSGYTVSVDRYNEKTKQKEPEKRKKKKDEKEPVVLLENEKLIAQDPQVGGLEADARIEVPENIEENAAAVSFLASVQEDVDREVQELLKLREQELREREEKLKARETELAMRETMISQKESVLKQKESELESRAATATFNEEASRNADAASEGSANGSLRLTGSLVQKSPLVKKNTGSTISARARARKTQGSNLQRERLRQDAAQKKSSQAQKSKNLKFSNPEDFELIKKEDEARRSIRNSKLLTMRSKVSEARTSVIMEEAGIESGHVLKLFERFERFSSASDQESAMLD